MSPGDHDPAAGEEGGAREPSAESSARRTAMSRSVTNGHGSPALPSPQGSYPSLILSFPDPRLAAATEGAELMIPVGWPLAAWPVQRTEPWLPSSVR